MEKCFVLNDNLIIIQYKKNICRYLYNLLLVFSVSMNFFALFVFSRLDFNVKRNVMLIVEKNNIIRINYSRNDKIKEEMKD